VLLGAIGFNIAAICRAAQTAGYEVTIYVLQTALVESAVGQVRDYLNIRLTFIERWSLEKLRLGKDDRHRQIRGNNAAFEAD
jgi:hypothetical protein